MFLAQPEFNWEADGDGQGVYSRPNTLCTVHYVLHGSEINDVPWPRCEDIQHLFQQSCTLEYFNLL